MNILQLPYLAMAVLIHKHTNDTPEDHYPVGKRRSRFEKGPGDIELQGSPNVHDYPMDPCFENQIAMGPPTPATEKQKAGSALEAGLQQSPTWNPAASGRRKMRSLRW